MQLSITPLSDGLADTVSTRWRRRLAGDGTDERAHWHTRTLYYRAVADLLAQPRRDPPTWREIVATVRPKGSRSTFYDVTGRSSKHTLLQDVLGIGTAPAHQLALSYLRAAAVDQLIDETKVWSYWPYRQGWLDQLHPGIGDTAAESLVCVLAEWARRNPGLAEAVDHAPPLCTVEDLVLIRNGRISTNRAFVTLGNTIRVAMGPMAEVAGGVLATVRDDLGGEPTRTADSDALLTGLAEQIFGLCEELRTLRPAQASQVRDLAAALVRDADGLLAAQSARWPG